MDFVQTTSLVLLAVILVLAIWRRVNIGLLGFAAAFVLITVSHLSPKQVFAHFPASIFTLLVGVSMLFTHLEKSGGLNWFVNKVYSAIGDRLQLIPWAGFIIGAAISTVGALSTAPITLLVPIIAAISRRTPTLFFISEMAVIIGANTAGLSPFNPSGSVILASAQNAHVSYSPWAVWTIGMVLAAVVVLIMQLLFRGKLVYEAYTDDSADKRVKRFGFALIHPDDENEGEDNRMQPVYAILSAVAVVAFVVLVIFFGTDVGFTSISLAVLLSLIFRSNNAHFLHKVPWGAVMVLCGLLTYVGSMQNVGTMDAIQSGLLKLTDSQMMLIFVIAYLTSILCNIESSTVGVISLVMPMLFSIMGNASDLTLIIAAIAAPATLSVVNPIHAAGTLIIGYTAERQQNMLFRRLLYISLFMAAVVPAIVSLLPAVLM